MKTMKYFLSMAALALVGAMTVSCSSDNDITAQPQQPETKNNVVTLTTTVGFDEAAGTTRALDINYTAKKLTKTFAVGETMVLRYKNTKDDWVKAVSNALEVGDIADGSKSATFTFTLTNPDKTKTVDYIYPAAIVNQSGNMDEDALFGSQDGTLNTIASTFDYSRKIGAWDGDNLPSLTLENQLAILAITLKDEAGTSDITSSITGMTLSDGTKTYNVTREAVAGRIYVAIFPTEDATITVTATDGTKNYTKTLTTKTYAKGNVYPVSWRMAEPEVPGSYFTANSSGLKVVFSQGNLQATYNRSTSTWTWAFAANQWDYIGNAEGNTKVTDASPYVSDYSGSSTTVDLFGWVGASSNFTGVAQYGITSSTTLKSEDGYGNDPDESMKAEWKSTNLTITNGGNYSWRTLTGGEDGEWEWIIGPSGYGTNCRASGATVNTVNGIQSNARYTLATINTDGTPVNGIILFPDGCKINSSSATNWGSFNTDNDWGTKCTTAQWIHLEELGCVFLPAAGYRDGAEVERVGSYGYYWSSSPLASEQPEDLNTDRAHNVYFASDYVDPESYDDRSYGYSVRLVREVEVP